jgi:hypothetical protein
VGAEGCSDSLFKTDYYDAEQGAFLLLLFGVVWVAEVLVDELRWIIRNCRGRARTEGRTRAIMRQFLAIFIS